MVILKKAYILILTASLTLFTVQCKKEIKKASFVVIFASNQSTVMRGSEKIVAAPGLVLLENDQIVTRDGTLDIQTSNGSALRIRPFSTVRLTSLGSERGSVVDLQGGSLMANVEKNREGFTVVMPTSIASVRGTTFSAEVGEGSTVKVLNGSVEMQPRIPALEKLTQEQLMNNPALKEVVQMMESQHIVLEEKSEGLISPQIAAQLEKLNTQIERMQPGATLAAPVPQAALSSHTSDVTPQEEAEAATLVTVDAALINSAAAESAPAARKALESKISEEHQTHLNQAITVIENKAAERGLKTEKEIQSYYNVLEVIVMRDGSKNSGAVVAQAGDVIVLHTVKGVFRVNKEQVDYIDYFHTQNR